MKNTLKNFYNIDANTFIKYSNKVYKVKNDEDEYCLKYINSSCSNDVIDKVNALNLNDSFIMPIKTCIRANEARHNNNMFLLTKWVEDDNINSKDLKLKYYLSKIASLHKKTSYTLNVTSSFYNEIGYKIEENIQETYQKYESIMFNIERKDYKSPFEWYFTFHFKDIVDCLDESKKQLIEFKKIMNDKLIIRQVVTHQNFAYDHVFLSKDKIIGNDRMKIASPIYDLLALFNSVEFGSIDISGIIDEYLKINELYDYEKKWLLSSLFIANDLKLSSNDKDNLHNMMNIIFRLKSIINLKEKVEQ